MIGLHTPQKSGAGLTFNIEPQKVNLKFLQMS